MTRTTARGKRELVTEPPRSMTVRCAIYTRKSTEEGLEQEFNSLDAQRESGEAYIKSQASAGWELVPTQYDDGGFTGGNMERPAFQRLLKDIEAGLIDCVVVYKVDRLSRSLLDFSRIMEILDRHQVSFVSVTQQFSTANSMGRLVLNVLLSFAQFEREIISERTRDKIAAARRKGKWMGGMPLLGYDISPEGSKLVVNPAEAKRVQATFELYLEHQSLMAVIRILDERSWLNKRWMTRKGVERGGKPFTKTSLHKLLTNVVYTGKLRYKEEIHTGEHASIVTEDVWKRTQASLNRNHHTRGAIVRNKFGAILKGLLRCVPCDCAMVPSITTKQGKKRYRYYVCSKAQKRGWQTCPSKSIPAAEIERFVVDQIRAIGNDPDLIRATVTQVQLQIKTQLGDLELERRSLERELTLWNAEIRKLVPHVGASGPESVTVARLADLQFRAQGAERRATEIREQIASLNGKVINHGEVAEALSAFDPIWEALSTQEQGRVIHLLVERVDYDGKNGKVAVTFHPAGIKAFADEFETKGERK